MTESIASWITLTALLSSAGWYIYRTKEKNISNIITAIMFGILSLFGGLLFSGAVMKITGSGDNAIIPSLLVCTGTLLSIVAHTLYINKKAHTSNDKKIPQ